MVLRHRTRRLKVVAVDSLVLAVEHFNRPSSAARSSGVLLPLQHSIEMLLKAAVFQARGTLFAKGSPISYSFREVVGISRGDLRILTEDDVFAASMVDAHRDAVQHYGSELREQSLYVDTLTGVTLFRDILNRAFAEALGAQSAFAGRTLPVAAEPPTEYQAIITSDFDHVSDLLSPGHRRRSEALAILRPYVLTDRAVISGPDLQQPTDRELADIAKRLASGESRTSVLPGLARLSFDESSSMTYELRITKSPSAAPVRLVAAADPDAATAGAVLEYNVLDKFPFLMKDLADKAAVNRYDCRAIIYDSQMKADPTMHREITMGKQKFNRYSHKALARVRSYVENGTVSEAREALRQRSRG